MENGSTTQRPEGVDAMYVNGKFNKFHTAFVMAEPETPADLPRVGCMDHSYMFNLYVAKADELVTHPISKEATIVYKGDLFNQIMYEMDSAWPYRGREFAVREGVRTDLVRNPNANVPPAEWKNPALWPWTIHLLADQLGMTVNIVSSRMSD